MKFLIFASLALLVFSQTCTQKMKCMDDTTENKDKCYSISVAETTLIEVKKCTTGSCYVSGTTGTCITTLKLDGEKCSQGVECHSGTCDNSVCVGKAEGAACSSSDECQKSLYCSGTCQKFKAIGEECTASVQCVFGAGCGITTEGGSPKCTKLYSINSGEYSSSAELCSTGYVTKEFKCASTTATNEGAECDSDEKCPIKIKVGNAEEVDGTGSCTCNLLDLKKYCEYSTGYSGFSNYLTKVKAYYDAENKNEYIARAKLGNTETKKLYYSSVVQYKNAPDCLIEYLVSSSSWIKVSFLTLFSILLF